MKNLSITAPTAFHFICSSVCLIPPTPIGSSLLNTLSIRSSIERRVTKIRDRDCPTSSTAVLFCFDPPEGAEVSVEMAPHAPEVAPEPFPLVLLATTVSLPSSAGNTKEKFRCFDGTKAQTNPRLLGKLQCRHNCHFRVSFSFHINFFT